VLHCRLQQQNCFNNNSDSSPQWHLTNSTVYVKLDIAAFLEEGFVQTSSPPHPPSSMTLDVIGIYVPLKMIFNLITQQFGPLLVFATNTTASTSDIS